MKSRKAKLVMNKAGSGSNTFRATIPTSWIREMGMSEDARNIKLFFDGNRIIIENNEEEVKMLNELLENAKIKIEEEMDLVGFIDDTDEADRFIDNLVHDLTIDSELDIDEVLEILDEHMKKTYKRKGSTENGHYSGCYYKNKDGLQKWEQLGE